MPRFKVVRNDCGMLQDELDQAIDDAVGLAAFAAQDHARMPAPVGGKRDSGTMVNETIAEHEEGSMFAEVNANADYSGYQNYGTRYMEGDGWFDRAVEHGNSVFADEMKAAGKGLG